jgi:hypothetical protein
MELPILASATFDGAKQIQWANGCALPNLAWLALALLAGILLLHGAILLDWPRRRIRRKFESQGIPCIPARSFISGNLREIAEMIAHTRRSPMPNITHDIAPRIVPHYYAWTKQYGKNSSIRYSLIP